MFKLNKVRNQANAINVLNIIESNRERSLEEKLIRFSFDDIMIKQNLTKGNFNEAHLKRFEYYDN